ncbi:MAG: PAAR domain-containing protein, partial [Desulfomicrobium sp.]|nr:PAAR domain-containing protein [Desulfomicrobium sp.]
RMGDLHVCPIPGHGVTPIVTGSFDTITEGLPNARIGDITACGAIIVTGSPDTIDN